MHWIHRALCFSLLATANLTIIADESPLDRILDGEPVELHVSEPLEAARGSYTEGDYEKAVVRLKAFLAASPSKKLASTAWFLLGESLAQLQRYEEAADAYRQLATLPTTATLALHAQFRLAEMLLFARDHTQAEQQLRKFRRQHADHSLNAYVLPYLARAVAANGDAATARALYQQALKQHPEGPLAPDCRLRLALLDYDAGKFEPAKRQLLALLTALPRADKRRGDATYWLAMCEFREENYERAAKHLRAFSQDTSGHEYADASIYFTGECQRKLEQLEQASATYQQLRARYPKSRYFFHALLGELKCLLQPPSPPLQAETIYRQLVAADNPTLVEEGTRRYVEILLGQHEFKNAWQLIRPLIQRPGSVEVSQQDREHHYRNLYLAALTLRGLQQPTRAAELLGRIRLRLCSQELAPRIVLARMQIAVDEGDGDRAIQSGLDALQAAPQGPVADELRAELVRAFIAANRLQEAQATLQQMQQKPTSRTALIRAVGELAEATYEANDLVNARRFYETLESWELDADDHAQVLSGLAWLDAKQGDYASAVRRLRHFLEKHPKHASVPDVQLKLAESLVQLHQEEQAVQVLSDFAQADIRYPRRGEALYRLAMLLEGMPARREDALSVTRRLIAEHPDYERLDAAWYLRGSLESSAAAAARAFRSLVTQFPSSKYWSDGLYRLAEKSAPQEAQRYLTKLISARRDTRVIPHALYLKGRLEADTKDWSASRVTLRKLIQDYPSSPLVVLARYGIAESFYQQGQLDHARRLFEILATEQLPSEEPWAAMVRLRRAQLLVKQSQFLEAIELAEKMETEFPAFPLQHEVDYVLGRAHAARGEFTRARRYYRRVVTADPPSRRKISVIAEWMIGESYLHQKDFERAIASFQRVSKESAYPKWQAVSLLQMGTCYQRLGQSERARATWSQLTRDFTASQWTAEAERRLRSMQSSSKETPKESS